MERKSTKRKLRIGLVYLDTPIIPAGGKYLANSVVNMFQHFGSKFDVDFICSLAKEGRAARHLVDLSSLKIVPISKSVKEGRWHSYRMALMARKLAWLFYARRCSWDIVLLTDLNPITELCFVFAKCLGLRVAFYLRGDAEKEIRLRRKRWPRSLPGIGYSWFLKTTAPVMMKGSIVVVAGNDLFDKYKLQARAIHCYAATSITDKHIQERTIADLSNSNHGCRLVYVGNLVAYKGVDLLIQSVAELKRLGLTCSAEIVGTGPEEQRLKSLAQRLHILNRVTFPGFVPFGEKLFAIYRHSSVFVLPSLTEGSPKTIPEAMSFGLPVVGSKVGGIPHLVEHMVEGILFEPGDQAGLTKAIIALSSDQNLWDQLSKNAARKAKSLTVDRQLEKLDNFLRLESDGSGSICCQSRT